MIWMREVAWGWIEQFETWPLVYQHIRKKGKEYESFLKHVCLLSAFLQQLTYRWLRSQVDDKMLIDSSLNLSFYRLTGFILLTNHWVMVCLQAIFYLHVYIFLLSEVMMEVFCWPLKLIFFRYCSVSTEMRNALAMQEKQQSSVEECLFCTQRSQAQLPASPVLKKDKVAGDLKDPETLESFC